MRGSQKVIDLLNTLLADELTAISQYMVHAGMTQNWGYENLHHINEHRAIDEMRHAEKLIDRILFFEGTPVVSNLNQMHIGAKVGEQLANDLKAEQEAFVMYNQAIRVCVEEADNGTRELLESNLRDEEGHIDWLEAQLDQIEQMGLPNYLARQVEEED